MFDKSGGKKGFMCVRRRPTAHPTDRAFFERPSPPSRTQPQVERGEVPDPDGIVLALGSACTTAGLALGVAIARAAGMKARSAGAGVVSAQPLESAARHDAIIVSSIAMIMRADREHRHEGGQ